MEKAKGLRKVVVKGARPTYQGDFGNKSRYKPDWIL